MAEVMEFKGKPVLCVCSSGKRMEELIGESKAMSGKQEFLLLLDYDRASAARVLPAYVNALIRQKDGIARSKSVWMEMLLLVSGTMNIGKAIREHGAKDSGRFLAFSTSESILRKFAEKNKVEMTKMIGLAMDEGVAGSVALTEIESG
jgi:tRNA threonylcarbamoyladenosine modification (KEOPS) complex Cgi121 subunit